MAENSLQIVLDLVDNASSEFRRINADAIRQVKDLERQTTASNEKNQQSIQKLNEATRFYKLEAESLGNSLGLVKNELTVFNKEIASGTIITKDQALRYDELKNKLKELDAQTKSTQNGYLTFNDTIKKFRAQIVGVAAVMALMIKGMNDAAQYSIEAKTTADNFNGALKNLSVTVGTIFQPAIVALTATLNGLRTAFEAVLVGAVKGFSFLAEIGPRITEAFQNVGKNIKNIFTKDEDPTGIVQGFQDAFLKAGEIADIAAQEIANKMAVATQNIMSGNTLEKQDEEKQAHQQAVFESHEFQRQQIEETADKETKQKENLFALASRIENGVAQEAKKAGDAKKKINDQLTQSSIQNIETYFKAEGMENKKAAVVFKGIQLGKAIIGTARGITEAFPNIPLMAFIAAAGAAQIATITSTGFNKGTDSVPSMLTPGEMVVPRDFASAIRSGALTLSGPGGGSFGDINIFIQGGIRSDGRSVSDVAETLGFEFARQVRVARG